jgi:hypothetical protein
MRVRIVDRNGAFMWAGTADSTYDALDRFVTGGEGSIPLDDPEAPADSAIFAAVRRWDGVIEEEYRADAVA